jgi:hypothetical protein
MAASLTLAFHGGLYLTGPERTSSSAFVARSPRNTSTARPEILAAGQNSGKQPETNGVGVTIEAIVT